MKIKFIINPFSGNKSQNKIEPIIHENLDHKRFKYDICFTEYRLHAKEITKKAVENNYNAIIAVGGDGTINEISSEIIGTDTALGIIPAGSGNGFAYHFGISNNIIEAILQLNRSKLKIIDSCIVNKYSFVNVSGIGFDAHIAQLFSKLKTRGFTNYVKLILRELNYKSKNYTIKYNGKSKEINALLISLANTTQYGNNFKISPNAKADDELIDFVIIRNMPKWRIPQFLIKISRGKIETSKFVQIIRTNKMEIIMNDNLIHLDGEPKNIENKLKISINPKSLTILIPNE